MASLNFSISLLFLRPAAAGFTFFFRTSLSATSNPLYWTLVRPFQRGAMELNL